MSRNRNLIQLFAEHPLAANLTMILMVLAGIWAINVLTIRLNAVQDWKYVTVQIVWRGASAEDVEKLVTNPLEQKVRSLNKVKSIRSTTRDTFAYVSVELESDADVQKSVDEIKQRVSQIRSLPVDIEPPIIFAQEQRDLVTAILISGHANLTELIPLARQMESELLSRGIDFIEFSGLPKQEIAIQIDSQTQFEMGLSFNEIGAQLSALSQDAPGGTIGSGQFSRQLRSLDQRRNADEFNDLPIYNQNSKQLYRLQDISQIEKRPVVDQPYAMHKGKPAILMYTRRSVETDALLSARIIQAWQEEKEKALPEGINVELFLEAWVLIKDEISLILGNGFTGLILVVITLLLFLQLRVAFWVMMGIPVTFLGALLGFYYTGGSINAISLIGVVMALGIVVDDAIVVGEESLTQFNKGKSPSEASILGANRMLAPVIASSLTTLCAFLPLMSLDNAPIQDIPLIMLWVIVASLVECFLILPGHLKHAFEKTKIREPGKVRKKFNEGFDDFRENKFRPLVRLSLQNRRIVISGAASLFLLMIMFWTNGWIKTELSLNINFELVSADVQFVGGASDRDKKIFMSQLEEALLKADEVAGDGNLVNYVATINEANINNERKEGSQYSNVGVELSSPEKRDVSAEDFASLWLDQVQITPVVDFISIKREEQFWSDFSILLKGSDTEILKQAGSEVLQELATLNGVKNIHDNLPYGKEQWIFSLTTEGRALGLSTGELGRQLRAAYDGQRIQIFQDQQNEIEVKLMLPEHERTSLTQIGQFPIKTPAGEMLPLGSVANIEWKRGIDVIRHHNTEKTIKISGDVDMSIISGREVVTYFEENIKEKIIKKYNVSTDLDGKSLAESETESDFGVQFLVVLTLIYIVLAWVFSSYTWPLAVMAAIPMGLTGALMGHLLLGLHIGPMSILGLFTLTGIIVNDSIILVSTYKNLVNDGMDSQKAIEEAVCVRLRAVILTSLTTIAGLFPLMLEQAPIAAMFTPLAAAICFGMLYGTVLVLLVIPALLSIIVTLTKKMADLRQKYSSKSDSESVPTS